MYRLFVNNLAAMSSSRSDYVTMFVCVFCILLHTVAQCHSLQLGGPRPRTLWGPPKTKRKRYIILNYSIREREGGIKPVHLSKNEEEN